MTVLTYTISNSSSYGFTYDSTNNKFVSGNKGIDSSSSTITIFTYETITISFNYSVSSERGYDKFTIRKNNLTNPEKEESGEKSGQFSIELEAGDSLTISYSKDVSGANGNDQVEITDFKINDKAVTSI